MPQIARDSQDQSIDIFIEDSSSTAGAGLTGLVYNSAGLTCYYRRGATGSATALSLATLATIGTAHADGGFKEVDATNMPGLYRLDLSDAICATGVDQVSIMLKGATDMAPCVVRVELVDELNVDSVGKVYISAEAQDLSTTLSVNTKAIDNAAAKKIAAHILFDDADGIFDATPSTAYGTDADQRHNLYSVICAYTAQLTRTADTDAYLQVYDTSGSPRYYRAITSDAAVEGIKSLGASSAGTAP